MVALKLFLAATAGGFAAAWPEPTALEPRAINCAAVTGCYAVLKKIGPAATSFCSSYLKIQGTKTATTTVTPPPVTVTTSTQTITTISSVCGIQKRNVPFDYRGFEYAEPADKRDNILGLLAAFAAAKISEGCSCFNLQPKTTTTKTATAAAPTTNVVATTTQCVLCKQNGDLQACTANNQCCFGNCQVIFGNQGSCCSPDGGPCDAFNPSACCSQICLVDNANGSGRCINNDVIIDR